MYGKFKHTVDAKGRLFVPSKLREELGSAFIVVKSTPFLRVYPEAVWQQKIDKLKEKSSSKIPNMLYIFGNVCRCEADKQGRFLLPEDYRIDAELTQEVMFVGKADCAEIWNAARYEADEAKFYADPELVAAAMEALEL